MLGGHDRAWLSVSGPVTVMSHGAVTMATSGGSYTAYGLYSGSHTHIFDTWKYSSKLKILVFKMYLSRKMKTNFSKYVKHQK